ncbi:MAG: flagellar protein export ATPase FliI [Pseudomonadota bacterium]
MEQNIISSLETDLQQIQPYKLYGRVTKILGMLVEIGGIERELSIGDQCLLVPQNVEPVPCEVIGFKEGQALAMPFGSLQRVGLGCKAVATSTEPVIYPSDKWLGRVINGFGQPLDGKGPLDQGDMPMPLRRAPPAAHGRKRLGPKLDLGVRAINSFLSTCQGQRMGIFAGSGVGKSVLMSMLARYTAADITVIGLIGERGREVQEFLEDELGEEGLRRSIVIVSTSDESPLMRRQAAYLTLSTAEYYRDEGKQVLCLMDSVTRFAMAQREIGLSAGEPPTSKGYPPTTFAELPKLLERAGPGTKDQGDITGFFTVLVEGDDHNEPISDAVRGILDGHIVLDRAIADRGRYPAINMLRSISRSMPKCLTEEQEELVREARGIISAYEDMEELIRLGAYREGSDPKVDYAISLYPQIEKFLSQRPQEHTSLDQGYDMLKAVLQPGGGQAQQE